MEYSTLLKQMYEKNKKMLESTNMPIKDREKFPEKKTVVESFPSAFSEFLQVFKAVPSHEERRAKIRKVLATTPSSYTSSVSELSDLFMAEGFGRELGNVRQPQTVLQMHNPTPLKHEMTVCTCTSCPFKKELRNIEEFYEDIFSQHNPPF